jgi:hypothetical protein
VGADDGLGAADGPAADDRLGATDADSDATADGDGRGGLEGWLPGAPGVSGGDAVHVPSRATTASNAAVERRPGWGLVIGLGAGISRLPSCLAGSPAPARPVSIRAT